MDTNLTPQFEDDPKVNGWIYVAVVVVILYLVIKTSIDLI